PFYDMLSGRLTRILVRINLVPIAAELHGDYVNDKNFKRSFQRWLNGLWEEKDRQLTDIMRDKER
ncbi:acyltransferase, partial [Mycobacterium tuberculosis]|nr:acyltransferase [Mycobacterium tuberculosis]